MMSMSRGAGSVPRNEFGPFFQQAGERADARVRMAAFDTSSTFHCVVCAVSSCAYVLCMYRCMSYVCACVRVSYPASQTDGMHVSPQFWKSRVMICKSSLGAFLS